MPRKGRGAPEGLGTHKWVPSSLQLLRDALGLEEQAEVRLDSLLSLLEPLIMGVMGMVVAFIVLATFLPMSKKLQKH